MKLNKVLLAVSISMLAAPLAFASTPNAPSCDAVEISVEQSETQKVAQELMDYLYKEEGLSYKTDGQVGYVYSGDKLITSFCRNAYPVGVKPNDDGPEIESRWWALLDYSAAKIVAESEPSEDAEGK